MLTSRSGAGAPVVGECEGDYRHDSRKNILEWRLPVIDASNKSGSMEFTVTGHTNDFFPVAVNFVSKKSFCDIEVGNIHRLFDACNEVDQSRTVRGRRSKEHVSFCPDLVLQSDLLVVILGSSKQLKL